MGANYVFVRSNVIRLKQQRFTRYSKEAIHIDVVQKLFWFCCLVFNQTQKDFAKKNKITKTVFKPEKKPLNSNDYTKDTQYCYEQAFDFILFLINSSSNDEK